VITSKEIKMHHKPIAKSTNHRGSWLGERRNITRKRSDMASTEATEKAN
jgi:hypothetical protein